MLAKLVKIGPKQMKTSVYSGSQLNSFDRNFEACFIFTDWLDIVQNSAC